MKLQFHRPALCQLRSSTPVGALFLAPSFNTSCEIPLLPQGTNSPSLTPTKRTFMGYRKEPIPLGAFSTYSSAKSSRTWNLSRMSLSASSRSRPYFQSFALFHSSGSHSEVHSSGSRSEDDTAAATSTNKYNIPQHVQEKIISAQDAVQLVQNGNVIAVSGFVCQGAPEAVLKALGERFEASQTPCDLTLLFGGGPGDYGSKGLSHLAKIFEDKENSDGPCKTMLRRTIGGHYGQVPAVAALALNNQVEAWTLPMGYVHMCTYTLRQYLHRLIHSLVLYNDYTDPFPA